jgi:NMD protein affecting ribosome stability and mRNA decay
MSTNCVKCVVNERTRLDLLCDACGKEKDNLLVAKKAIQHVLTQIRDDSSIGWYMGYGTQSFDLLTRAAAVLWGEDHGKVEEMFMPKNAKDPTQELAP